ncbi:WD40 repeat protein [Algoriphagus boseongensis]|uniref:WD40 repeat protein n=1 Tax=Algoriphagus boseongensis TaxID=1442587 RepID=A0A4V3D292_9BACT|nr:PD40 domain-containing protein [Algoriphagus boseongensis]TDQ17540.1 WD40 repeat protein [Algoriphagus boseongensis]
MKSYSALILCLVFGFSLGCAPKFKNGQFPEEPVNLREINSPYDDINSDIPFITHQVPLVFSTNRSNAQTRDFNLTVAFIDFNWDKSEGLLTFNSSNTLFDPKFDSFRDMVRRTESSSNEKGPYSFIESSSGQILLYSREENGVYSIHVEPEKVDFKGRIAPKFRIMGNSGSEMYPSFYGKEFLKGAETNSKGRPELLLFTSDQEGHFDIYEADIPSSQSVLQFLLTMETKTLRKLSLNTTANEHMPFVYGDILVFSSDRPGGYGGYDLYYSQKTGSGWSEPVNFGPKINSEFDEYRPVVSDAIDFSNRLMIFSSNRPGGMGGFDLYFVGIPKF